MENQQGGLMHRPSVLADVSTTQLDELERQYNEQDHSAWNTLTESYGWTSADASTVWAWFSQGSGESDSSEERRDLSGGGSDSGGSASDTRPAVLNDASETQMDELERQYAEKDQAGWNTLTESYGWSADDSDAVWKWFGDRPRVN